MCVSKRPIEILTVRSEWVVSFPVAGIVVAGIALQQIHFFILDGNLLVKEFVERGVKLLSFQAFRTSRFFTCSAVIV